MAPTKRVRLSNAVKLKVIERVSEKISHRRVAEEFGISKTQVTRIFQNKENIRHAVETKNVSLNSKVSKASAKYPEVDQQTHDWFVKARYPAGRCKPLPVTSGVLKMRALQISVRLGIRDFKASNGWLARWKGRYSVGKSVRLHGEASDVDISAAEKPMNELRNKLRDYKPENVFNMDETGLFFRALPNRSYVLSDVDSRQYRRGSKSLTAKDRVTLVMCVNATGTCKIDPLMIGSSKEPRCFRIGRCPIPYTHQSKAWLDRNVYRHWWQNVLLPHVRQWTTEKVALIMDGFSGHDSSLVDPLGQAS